MTVQFESHFKLPTIKNVVGMPNFEIISGKRNVQRVSVEIMNRTVLGSQLIIQNSYFKAFEWKAA